MLGQILQTAALRSFADVRRESAAGARGRAKPNAAEKRAAKSLSAVLAGECHGEETLVRPLWPRCHLFSPTSPRRWCQCGSGVGGAAAAGRHSNWQGGAVPSFCGGGRAQPLRVTGLVQVIDMPLLVDRRLEVHHELVEVAVCLWCTA